MKKLSVIIVAAGNATRMGGINKQFIEINNKPVIMHSIEKFCAIDDVLEIIVVTKSENFTTIENMCSKLSFCKKIEFVEGGDTRQISVMNGLNCCDVQSEFIAIHDGARPLVSNKDLLHVFDCAYKYSAATLGVMSKDTIKIIDENGFIQSTPNRANVYITQTPQVFRMDLYKQAVANALTDGKDYTDDCQLIESLGVRVYMANGSYKNIKITTPEDELIAQVLTEDEV